VNRDGLASAQRWRFVLSILDQFLQSPIVRIEIGLEHLSTDGERLRQVLLRRTVFATHELN
jgi:hypothetical protein